MKADLQKIKRDLKAGKFDDIFKQELGWDNLQDAPVEVSYKGQKYLFTSLTQKRGFKIYLHIFPDRIPEEQLLKQLDKGLNDFAAAHLTIFVDAKRENQAWLWVKQVQQGKTVRLMPRLYRYNKNQN